MAGKKNIGMGENLSEDYSQLHRDLIELIVERLDKVCDRSRFGAVCTSWRSAATEVGFRQLPPNQFPGLMVPGLLENSETRRFLQLNYKTGLFEELADDDYSKKWSLLVPHRHHCRGTSYGWIFITDVDLNTRLLNPFTGAELQLPAVTTLPPAAESYREIDEWSIYKAVISSNPSHQPRPTVLIIHGGNKPRLAFSEPGDNAWTCLKSPDFEHCYYFDAIYCNEQFYALSHPGYVIGYDIRRCSNETSGGFYTVKMTRIAPSPKFKLGFKYTEDMYLVELEGKLVTLSRHASYDVDPEDVYSDTNAITSSEDDDDDDDDDNDVDTDDDFFGHSKVLDELFNQQAVCTCHHNDDHNNIDNVDDVNSDDSEQNSIDNDNDEGEDDDNDEGEVDDNEEGEDDDGEEDDDDEEDDDEGSVSPRRRTDAFRILRFEASRKRWVNVENLGDNSLFVGYNASFSLRASDYPAGCIVPNSVYFTEDRDFRQRKQSGFDMGIYNVTNR